MNQDVVPEVQQVNHLIPINVKEVKIYSKYFFLPILRILKTYFNAINHFLTPKRKVLQLLSSIFQSYFRLG